MRVPDFYIWSDDDGYYPSWLERIALPSGATGLQYDDVQQQFVVSFNSAFDENIGKIMKLQREMDDRVMYVGLPIIQASNPRVRRNIQFIRLLGAYVWGPSCLVPVSPVRDCFVACGCFVVML